MNKISKAGWCTVLLIMLNHCPSLGQSKKANAIYSSVYAQEFKQIGKIPYNIKLLSLSDTFPKKNWNSYQGGAIHTEDSLFYFNGDQLCFSFPSNSDKIRNNFLVYYFSQKTAKCPTLFSLLKYYQPILQDNLAKNNLPQELQFLPVVCSAFNPNSSNGVGGEGFWHLNYPQAIKYGLTVNDLVDERRDFQKSTQAAARYLKDLHKLYKNWELTLTAYASGVTTVNKLLKRKSASSYKEIYPYLPQATKDIVQAFVAMNYIYNYDSYGAVTINPIIEADTVQIDRKLRFEAINHVIKTNTKDFQFLNITLNKEVFPANYRALFPKGFSDKFNEFKDSIYYYQDSVLLKPKEKEPQFIIPKDGEHLVYTVSSGDVLGVIAERYNVSVSQIQNWNDLSGTRIDIGQKLTIYGKKKKSDNKKSDSKTKDKKTPAPKPKSKSFDSDKYTNYTVKSGDNLWLIAKKYSGISAQNIMDFNEIDENLNVGQVLKIPKK